MADLTCELAAPTPDVLTIGESGTDAEYRQLCEQLGIRNAAVVRADLEAVLFDEGIRVYSRTAVNDYMGELVKAENARLEADWCEKNPEWAKGYYEEQAEIAKNSAKNRAKSITYTLVFSQHITGPPTIRWDWRGIRKCDAKRTNLAGLYPHAIPYSALLTMASILARVKDALFFVSNYEAVKPDPFMLVTHKLLGLAEGYVIDRWNEPRFRD